MKQFYFNISATPSSHVFILFPSYPALLGCNQLRALKGGVLGGAGKLLPPPHTATNLQTVFLAFSPVSYFLKKIQGK